MAIDEKSGTFFTTIKALKTALDQIPEGWEVECHPTLNNMALLCQNDDGSEYAVINMSSTAIDWRDKDGGYRHQEAEPCW